MTYELQSKISTFETKRHEIITTLGFNEEM